MSQVSKWVTNSFPGELTAKHGLEKAPTLSLHSQFLYIRLNLMLFPQVWISDNKSLDWFQTKTNRSGLVFLGVLCTANIQYNVVFWQGWNMWMSSQSMSYSKLDGLISILTCQFWSISLGGWWMDGRWWSWGSGIAETWRQI